MDRFAVLVDAGYLLSQAVQILSAKASRSRADIQITDPKCLVALLIEKASKELANDKLLRVYWYDGVGQSLSAEHRAIISIDDVQLRAGTINGKGQQKGVDSKIVTDLIELATNQAISDALLVTGDGDLAIGIELAQRRGVRVAVMGLEDMSVGVHNAQSSEISNFADRIVLIGKAELATSLAYVPKQPKAQATTSPTAATPVTTTPQAATPAATPATVATPVSIDQAVLMFISSQTPPLDKSVISSTGSVDRAVDRALIHSVFVTLGQGALTEQQKRNARSSFKKQLT